MTTPANIVTQALQQMLTDPVHDEDRIAAFFAPHYEQQVDGKTLNYKDFVDHMALLKKVVRSLELNLITVASEHNEVLTHHKVNIDKNDGSSARFEIFAHFTVQDRRIIRCEELTRLLSGTTTDQALGGMTTA